MIQVGQYNNLRVVKVVDFGVYLDGEERGEILLPNEYVPKDCFPEDFIKVFIYFDSEDRIIATTETPYIKAGEFAFLKVVSVSSVGAFMDIGLRKDILVPFREQQDKMQEGNSYLVYAYVDKASDRLVASSKIDKYLDNTPPDYKPWEEVDILVARRSELGYNVIINNMHWGIIYKSEVFDTIKIGQRLKGYIKKIREDEKIDVALQKPGYDQIEELAERIFKKMEDYGGVLDITDKSEPEKIYNLFGCSKKNYKKALGLLFKQKRILISDKEISIIEAE